MNKYFLYRHIRLDKNEPFYIGIGTKSDNYSSYKTEFNRAYSKSGRNKYWHNIVNKTNYTIDILFESDNQEIIDNKEIEFIKLYGRKDLSTGLLVNLREGGKVNRNFIPYIKTKELWSKQRKGIKLSENHKENISKSLKGRVFSKEWKKNLSISNSLQLNSFSKDIIIKRGNNIKKSLQEKYKKPILQFSKDNVLIKEWDSIYTLIEILNLKKGSVYSVLNGYNKTLNNFKFIYK